MIQWYKGREDYYCLELNFGGRKNSGSSNTIILKKTVFSIRIQNIRKETDKTFHSKSKTTTITFAE